MVFCGLYPTDAEEYEVRKAVYLARRAGRCCSWFYVTVEACAVVVNKVSGEKSRRKVSRFMAWEID